LLASQSHFTQAGRAKSRPKSRFRQRPGLLPATLPQPCHEAGTVKDVRSPFPPIKVARIGTAEADGKSAAKISK
jgi:hypothetical protein